MFDKILLFFESLDGLVPVVCAVISGIVSWVVSKNTTIKEMSQLKLTWSREDLVHLEENYCQMEAAVLKYIHISTQEHQVNALTKIIALRRKESHDLAFLLDDLYMWVENGNPQHASNALNAVIYKRRQINSPIYNKLSRMLKKH